MTRAIGIDVGGTKIAAGLVDTATGVVEARSSAGRGPERDAAAVLADCVGDGRRLAAGQPGVPIGIGVCELVDREGHTQSAQSSTGARLDVAGAFAAIGPAVVESDVRAAAVAEARFGGGRGVEDLLYVIVGHGHLVLPRARRSRLRGRARQRDLLRRAAGRGRRERPRPRARRAGASGPRTCSPTRRSTHVVEAAAAALGAGLAWLVNALDPGMVVIGGGLGLVDRYRDLAVPAMRPMIFADNSRDLPVAPAQLGADAGVIGAALAAVLH